MASDLSFNIVALDKASQTFIKLAEQVDRLSAKIDRLDGKDATVKVDVKTDESTKALDSFTNRWALMSAGIIAGSPAVGAAIVAGVGAGFIATAVLAQKSNADVQKTYTTLWQNVVQQTKSATASLVPVIVDAGNQLGQTFERLGPLLQAGFAAAGPEIVSLTRGVTDFAQNAMPGLVSMVERSQTVFSALATTAGTLGSAVGRAFADIGNNAQSIGGFVTSLGSILSTVLGLAVTLMNDVARVWAQNGAAISSAIQGIANVASGLASGALPILSAALGAAAQIVTGLASVLAPLSGTLGFVATAALAAWAAFKGASAITDGIKALSGVVLNAGASMENIAAKAAAGAAAMQGTSAAGSAAAAGMRTAATAASGAALSFSTAAETLAGPLGIALAGVTLAIGLLSSSNNDAEQSTQNLKAAQDSLTSAFEQSGGAINAQVISSLNGSDALKQAADASKQFGISQQDLVSAVSKGGPALEDLKAKLQGIIDANHELESSESGDVRVSADDLNATGTAAKKALDGLNGVAGAWKNSRADASQASKAVQEHTNSLLTAGPAYAQVAAAATAAGVGFNAATASLSFLGSQAKDTSGNLQGLLAEFAKDALATANAAGTISKTFSDADKQVAQSSQSVADAQYGVSQAARGVADAQHSEAQAAQQVQQAQQGVASAAHSVETAQRSLRDAIQGVSQAQYQYNQSLQAERDAEQALSDARQQAVRDIQAVHDALANSQTSEANARLSLFNAQNTAAGLGVTDQNARQLAFGTQITSGNQERIKAAIDLISAQNQLAQATEQANNAKQDAAAADRAGVNGAKGVVSAQRSLIDSQRQVQDSARAVQRAQEQVSDASFGLTQAQQGLQRAQQAVTDAGYAQQKAHQAVQDAQVQERRASQQLSTAQDNLRLAQDNASRSLDLSTEAGRRNLLQLFALSDAVKNQFGPTQQGYKVLIDDVAAAFGLSKDKAAEYLKQLGLIDPNYKFGVTAVGQVDLTPLKDFAGQGGYFKDGFRAAGGNFAFADGGLFRGAGGPTDDANLIAVSDNEYIQKASAVNFWGVDFMDDINNHRVPSKFAGAFAGGGLVSQNYWGAGASIGYEAFRNPLTVMGVKNLPQLPKYVPTDLPSFGGGGGGAIPTGQHLALIDAALAADGIPRSAWPRWEAGLNVLIQRESSWNPNSINLWDSNAKAGHPSMGLMQTIASTFAGNRNPSLPNNVYDPVSNIAAGINYIIGRYGDISNVQQANPNLPHRGYAQGGLVKAIAAANIFDGGGILQSGGVGINMGRPEAVLTPDESAAYKTVAQAAAKGQFGGKVEKHYHLTVQARTVDGEDIRREFRKMELESGMV